MCGIGGIWGARPLDEPARVAHSFLQSIVHRGPDGSGILGIAADPARPPVPGLEESIAALGSLRGFLAHARLSILDLSTGDQPMATADRQAWIVFNGEIYNYLELRDELAAGGAEFRTRSDTEVILQAYRHWGVSGFRRLNGIFAFALYDVTSRHLVLARDPVGVKPLYWTRRPEGIAFASEIRPLRLGGGSGAISPERLAQYLFYRFVPSPGTLWNDIAKVVPGHAITFDERGRVVEETDFAEMPATPRPITGDWVSGLAAEFRAAVNRQTLADVPVGAFLSGGLDSSMVVAAMAREGGPPGTFAIGFESTVDTPSELLAARVAADALGADHQGMEVRAAEYMDRFTQVIGQVEEPLAEPGMLLLSDISAFARRKVKVVLTGQGADEPLGGYPRHQAARLAGLLAPLLGSLARSGGLHSRRDTVTRFIRTLAAPAGAARAAAPFSALTPADVGALVRGCGRDAGQDAVLEGVAPWWKRSEGMDDIARILYCDVRTSLADDLLLMGDKTSMAHGLEARVPFLDLKYLRHIESIPGNARVPLRKRRKWIQHQLAREILPPSLAATLAGSANPFRKKRGFEVPVDIWLRERLGSTLVGFLSGNGSVLPAYIDGGFVRRTTEYYLSGNRQAYRMVFALYVLEVWLRNATAEAPRAGVTAA